MPTAPIQFVDAQAEILSAGVSVTGDATGFCIGSAPGFAIIGGVPFSGPMVTEFTLQAPGLTGVSYGDMAIYFAFDTANFAAVETFAMGALRAAIGETFQLGLPVATSINLAALERVHGDFGGNYDVVPALDLGELNYVGGGFDLSAALCDTVDLHSLVIVGEGFNAQFPAATAVDLSALAEVRGDFFADFSSATTLSLPSFTRGGLGFLAPLITALDLPAAIAIGPVALNASVGSLVTVTLNPGLESVTGQFNLEGAALDEASVDHVLGILEGLDGTGGTSLYENQTVDLSGGTSAPPSVAGLVSKTALELRGCTVNVN